MAFNFKNNNLTIILLLILVIGSSMCYLMMEKSIEGFSLKGFQPTITNNFTSIGGVPGKIDRNYLILNESKRYVLNSNPYPSAISELESTGDFNFRNKVGKDLSYNAFLYQRPPASAIPSATTNDISYDLYNLQLNETYDLSSLPAGTGSTTGEKNADLSGTTNILMVIDSSGYFYDVSGNNRKLGFNLKLDEDYIILNGEMQGSIPTDRGYSSSTGWSGDINFKDMFKGLNNGQLPPNMTPELVAYMLQGSMGSGNQGYAMPYYNSFESAMNNPSNPLVNPTNAMNPLQYNQSLFGPNVSPMMSQNMCKNSSADKGTKVREDDKKDSKSKDGSINSSLGSNNVLNSTFDKLNSSANTMLAQNTGDEGKTSSSGSKGSGGTNNKNNNGNVAPCPPCARCPESNFECKKVPSYEQGYENTSLPRPVLSDFSTFGI